MEINRKTDRHILHGEKADANLSKMRCDFECHMYVNKTCTSCIRPGLKQIIITKTCPCNVYPLEPHFYIVKLGFAGVYLSFLLLIQNIHCGYSLEPPRRGGSNVYPQCMF